ncbi:hypothetical protein BJX66DRAFT_352284 [Aspergillus keveii]|uniref:F-box domain-containing protein n=1 Tax=Aspergillus keveii TaxID=714993 RepID=A0ABR4G0M9_9EURO
MVTLSSLPLETLEIITSHLADYKLSLYAVSQVNRRCNAASKIRFRAITLRLSSLTILKTEIESWHTILERNLAFGVVRHLTISGRLFAIPADEADEQEEHGNPLPMVIVQHDQGEDELTRRGEVYDDILRGRFYHLGVKEELSDDPWKPVAGFLKRLTGLKEVVWACERWFPQPLLDVLHGVPGCQLHVKAFDPPRLIRAELNNDDDDPDDESGHDSEDTGLQSCDMLKEGCVDEYGYRLATSPCLTSVVVPVAYDDPHRNSNEEAVQWMVRGLTPSLKHVHIIDSGPGFAYRTIPRASSGQYILGDELDDEMGPGELESLSLDPTNEERFEVWEQAISFSRLRNLQLWRARRSTLARARLCDLSSLRTLALDVFNDRHSIDASPVDRAVAGFLTSLPRLESLHLTGPWSTETFTAVLQHHGRSVRTLSLHPSETRRLHQFLITPSKIQALGKYCPNLRDIRLQVKRSAGDQEEQEIYGAIAALPKVRHVSLQLDIYNPVKVGLPERSLERDSEHVRQIFINMAVDAKLAEEIARLIASQGHIETVTLDIGINVTGILGDVARYMKRQWKCFIVPRDTVDLEVVVKEINVERRKRRQKGEADTKMIDFAKAFPSVWTQDVDLSDWRHAWHSFPLQKVEE